MSESVVADILKQFDEEGTSYVYAKDIRKRTDMTSSAVAFALEAIENGQFDDISVSRFREPKCNPVLWKIEK